MNLIIKKFNKGGSKFGGRNAGQKPSGFKPKFQAKPKKDQEEEESSSFGAMEDDFQEEEGSLDFIEEGRSSDDGEGDAMDEEMPKKGKPVDLRKKAVAAKKQANKGSDEKQEFKKKEGEGEQARGVKRKTPEGKKVDRQEHKKQRREMKMQRPNAQVFYEAKVLWEELRQKAISDARRHEICTNLLGNLEGKFWEMCLKRDMSRVVQAVIKYGSKAQRQKVFDELNGRILDLVAHPYSHFLVQKMMKYGEKSQREAVIKQFYGKVAKLSLHKEAALVLENIFNLYATAQQRHSLAAEFFGPEYALFKDKNPKSFEEIVAAEPNKKRLIIDHLKQLAMNLSNKPTALTNSIVHLPLLKFFEHGTNADVNEVLPFLRDHLVRFLHTREGAKTAALILGYGKAKDRKLIVKSFKSYAVKIATEEFGHAVLLKTFECVDDTLLVVKSLFPELLEKLTELSEDKHGRLIILAALEKPSSKYFPPATLSLLEPTMVPDEQDPTKLVPSHKKEESARRKELRDGLWALLFAHCRMNAYSMLTNLYARNVFEEVYALSNPEERTLLREEVLQWVAYKGGKEAENEEEEGRKYHPMEERPVAEVPKEDLLPHSLAHRVLRRLVEEDAEFGRAVLAKMKNNMANYALEKSASWVLISLLESEASKEQTASMLKPLLEKLKSGEETGTKILVTKLAGTAPAQGKPQKEKGEKKAEQVKTPPAKTVGSTPAKTIEAKLTPAKSIDVKSPPAKMETTTTPAKKAGPLTKSTPEKASASPKPTPSSEVASTPSGKKLTPMKKK